jgi:hypothetical protein
MTGGGIMVAIIDATALREPRCAGEAPVFLKRASSVPGRILLVLTLGILIAIAVVPHPVGHAQTSQISEPDSHRVSVTATARAAVAESTGLIARMLQAAELTSMQVQNDQQMAGRQLHTLQQVYKGIPVEGGSVSLQSAGQTTVSVFGTLFHDIDVDTEFHRRVAAHQELTKEGLPCSPDVDHHG